MRVTDRNDAAIIDNLATGPARRRSSTSPGSVQTPSPGILPAPQAGRESLYIRESRGWRRLTGRSARVRAFITDSDDVRNTPAELFFEVARAQRLPGTRPRSGSRDVAGTLKGLLSGVDAVVIFAGLREYRGPLAERVCAAGILPTIHLCPSWRRASSPRTRRT